ncbi:MAG: GlsB/YeaQ/YmgE family stress response membrane protein [Clostridia bacterium]|nr:GlsB/YeaQ/YmgE family stress response membrane protein [Clostridia bacterium]
MNILLWIVLGALAGWLAGLIMGGEKRGWLGNIVVGILGAAVGGLAASLLGLGGVDGFNLYSLLVAVGGSCLLLWIYGMLQRREQK